MGIKNLRHFFKKLNPYDRTRLALAKSGPFPAKNTTMKLKRAITCNGKTSLLKTEGQLFQHRGLFFAVAEIDEERWIAFCAFTGASLGAGTHPTQQEIVHCCKAVIQYRTPELIELTRNKIKTINNLTHEQIGQAETL